MGDTAVSADGKWLTYSAITVDLDQNTKTAKQFIQPIVGGDAKPLAVSARRDGGVQFAPGGHSVLFLSGRSGSQQVWLADFDPATGAR